MKNELCPRLSRFFAFAILFILPIQANARSLSVSVGARTEVAIDAPPQCATTPLIPDATYQRGCSFTDDDGDTRSVSMQVNALPLADFMEHFFRASTDDFAANPEGYLRSLLIAMEEQATSLEPATGQKVLASDFNIRPSIENPAGLDECLVFDFDFAATTETGQAVRLDGTGVRCLGYDPSKDQVTYVYVKYANGHNNLAQRTRNFELEAREIITSLRIE